MKTYFSNLVIYFNGFKRNLQLATAKQHIKVILFRDDKRRFHKLINAESSASFRISNSRIRMLLHGHLTFAKPAKISHSIFANVQANSRFAMVRMASGNPAFKSFLFQVTYFPSCLSSFLVYRQTSNISHTSVGNKIVDHSDVVGAAPTSCRRCSSYIFILNLTPGFNGLGIDNCKTRWETLKFGDLVLLILEIW